MAIQEIKPTASTSALPEALIWIDLEMTGLDVDQDTILEIATIVTDHHGDIIAMGPNLAVHCDDNRLIAMDDWNQRTHADSGLIKRVRNSTISLAEAEEATLAFLHDHVSAGSSPMCGNSICQDRRFLHREMPRLARYFHYRHLDVSTLKILAQLWGDDTCIWKKTHNAHQAQADIIASIEEFKHYRRVLFDSRWQHHSSPQQSDDQH